jgi:SsrA-binding protein
MAKKKKQQKSISNRRASFDYEIKETLVAGVQLTGAETRAIRQGQADLRGAFVTVKDNELWLTNATVSGSHVAPISEEDKTRGRKILAKRREITRLIEAKKEGMTIIPLEILNSGRYIKIRIATATGKKLYDKRATLKARDDSRNIQRYTHNPKM